MADTPTKAWPGLDVLAELLGGLLNARMQSFPHAKADTQEPFLLHLDGAWGSGKSTMLRVSARICRAAIRPGLSSSLMPGGSSVRAHRGGG